MLNLNTQLNYESALRSFAIKTAINNANSRLKLESLFQPINQTRWVIRFSEISLKFCAGKIIYLSWITLLFRSYKLLRSETFASIQTDPWIRSLHNGVVCLRPVGVFKVEAFRVCTPYFLQHVELINNF